MKPVDDLSRSLVAFDQESAVVAVVELSNASWLVAGTLPGVARRPVAVRALAPDSELSSDRDLKRRLLHMLRWRAAMVSVGL